MSEMKQPTAGNGSTTEEIFLSPRVVDRQAFSEFATQLRALIEEASAKGEMLRTAASDAERARDGLREAINTNQMKLDMTARALSTIDQRAEQTRKLIDGASDAVSRIEDLRSKADQVITETLGVLSQRINEAEQAAVSQIEQAHGQLSDLVTKADARISALNGAVDSAITPSVAVLDHLVKRAESLVGTPIDAPADTAPSHGSLQDLIMRAESLADQATFSSRQLDEVRKQSEQARRILGDSVNAAVPLIDEVANIQGHLETAIAEALKLSQNVQKSITDQVTAQRAAIQADLEQVGPLTTQARTELLTTIEAAHSARRAAMQVTSTTEQAAEHLADLLGRLEPWQSILVGEGAISTVPAPLQNILDGVRVELKNDLATVASSLRAIADRAERALEPTVTSRATVVSRSSVAPSAPAPVHPAGRPIVTDTSMDAAA